MTIGEAHRTVRSASPFFIIFVQSADVKLLNSTAIANIGMLTCQI